MDTHGNLDTRNPYLILDVSPQATAEEIRRAYRRLSKLLHPDKDRSVPNQISTARFQQLKGAYDVLADPPRRRAYDSVHISRRPTVTKSFSARTRSRTPASSKVASAASTPKNSSCAPKASEPTAPLLVLDSDEEDCVREEEWEVHEAVCRANLRRRADRAEQQAKLIRQREATDRQSVHESHNSCAQQALGYMKIVFRTQKHRRPSIAELESAFADYRVRVIGPKDGQRVPADSQSIVLGVHGGPDRAVACALAFHGWHERSVSEDISKIFALLGVLTAPVTASGRAIPGNQATIAVTRQRVVACDREGISNI